MKNIFLVLIIVLFVCAKNYSQTIVLWTFDEQEGIYPSSVINDISDNDYPLVIGFSGKIVKGKFGNALTYSLKPNIPIPPGLDPKYGLVKMSKQPGRKVEPLTWHNADFCALMTSGENHLRKEVGFVNPTRTKMNLGEFDWTVEFWFEPLNSPESDGVIFEIGSGPRGENNKITQLIVSKDLKSFTLFNQPSGTKLTVTSPIESGWHHYAFVYSATEKQLKHFVDGKLQPLPKSAIIKSLPVGEEDYMCLGTNGMWKQPVQCKLDELRFSEGQVYKTNFVIPGSFSPLYQNEQKVELKKGPPLLFENEKLPLQLLDKKYLFIDNAIIKEMNNVTFNVNPPRYVDRVISNIQGAFRKHINVVEDENGLIRMYMGIEDDYLGVLVSKDGKNFEAPDLGREHKGRKNVAIAEPCAMGMTFIDPNAPLEEKWKYVSDFNRRGINIWTSPDGFNFHRIKTPVLPFRSGSQSNIFYDDQKQVYVSYHRTDMGATKYGETERDFVMSLATDIKRPWPFKPLSLEEELEIAKTRRTHKLFPWYLDNGPLTPGGFGLEYPWIFTPREGIDPEETDIYVPKAHKYEWAPDTYLAFPVIYYHYEAPDNPARFTLFDEKRNLGSGPTDIQLEVSRDGVNWKRYPMPTYIPIGTYDGDDIKQVYTTKY
ncbi:MAG: LamG domain-containing protein [Ignavibacteria bacterium]|nr:LamG domain-containing protein [Ignavibacteria bacterium]